MVVEVKQEQVVLELNGLLGQEPTTLAVVVLDMGLTAYHALPALVALVAAVRVVLLEVMEHPARQIKAVVVVLLQQVTRAVQAVQVLSSSRFLTPTPQPSLVA